MMTQGNKAGARKCGATVLYILAGLFVIAAGYRLAAGLGAATNLSDTVPWGLWVGIDILVGEALAAGGFAIVAAVYIFNLKKYAAFTRPAVLTAFIGYVVATLSIFLDLGKPQAIWHPLVLWQTKSVMFLVVWSVVLYTVVLVLEFSGPFLEAIKAKSAGRMTGRAVMVPIAIAAVVLSFLHQSSMGGLFLLMPDKLNHLWWTTILPYNFFLSALAVGLAMVTIESAIAAKVLNHATDHAALRGLAKGTAITLAVYFTVRLVDILLKGNIDLLLNGGLASVMFVIEMVILTLVPMALLWKASTEKDNGIATLLVAQFLVVAGVVLNRVDVLASTVQVKGYLPSLIEAAITVGLVAIILLVWRLAMTRLPIIAGDTAGENIR